VAWRSVWAAPTKILPLGRVCIGWSQASGSCPRFLLKPFDFSGEGSGIEDRGLGIVSHRIDFEFRFGEGAISLAHFGEGPNKIEMSPTPRRSRRISTSFKSFRTLEAIWHLFGQSFKHGTDAILSKQWQERARREKLLEQFPAALRGRIERVVIDAGRREKELRAAADKGLMDSGFVPGPALALESMTVLDVAQGRFGPGTGSLVFNLGCLGEPGQRQWTVVNEVDWDDHLTWEMGYRSHYVTADRHPRGPKDGVLPRLWNLYGRLSPWWAEVIGNKFERMGVEGRAILEKLVISMAAELADELGADVIGIAVHREGDGDLHVHFVLSETREVLVPKCLPKREFEAMVSSEARRRMKAGDTTPFVKFRKIVRSEFVEAKKDKMPYYERQRGGHKKDPDGLPFQPSWKRPVQTLGPAFTGKLALWLASGKDPAIAAKGDRPYGESKTFRSRVVDAVERGEDLAATHIDYWATSRLTEKIKALLTPEEVVQAEKLAAASVERYRRTGSDAQTLEAFVVGEVAKMEERLPSELLKKAEELETREKAVDLRERGADVGLPEWLVSLVDRLPGKRRKYVLGKVDYKITVTQVFEAAHSLWKVRAEVRNFVKRKGVQVSDLVGKLKGMLGLEKKEVEKDVN